MAFVGLVWSAERRLELDRGNFTEMRGGERKQMCSYVGVPTTHYLLLLRIPVLLVSIAHTSHVRMSSIFLFLSVGNYKLKRRCALKNIIIVILGFVKIGWMVKTYKCKWQTNNDTRTLW